MAKIPIYCIPGLGSGPEIFKNLNLSEELYEVFTLKWIEPISNQEKITDYAKRMCKQVLKVNPVLLGVSFGGIMAQEMGNHLNCKKIILISSIKHQTEKPKIFKFLKVTKLYQLAPCSLITNLEQYRIFFIGVKLKKKFNNIKTYLKEVKSLDGDRIENVKTRLKKAIDDLKVETDENRFEQELIYYLEKLDINEEKVRLANHLDYFLETLALENSNGKKLGFIVQEMGREINTTGSKANFAPMQKAVIQMKNELEQIKEQILNVL